MTISSLEFQGIARGTLKGKLSAKAPKYGNPKARPKKNRKATPQEMGPSLRSNPSLES
jgi:hypothetical protein